ncbi:MAG: RluA family pseudouridine synthase [Clostridia bacterium]|jgi:23S rRNA pseudouridine1911/1915/1917 synthase|nr:RluA family pseudouridine synthase [Clostridia bacterium]
MTEIINKAEISEKVRVIYEDNQVLVVIKPQNLAVCEDASKDPDLLNELKQYIKVKYNKTGNVFLALVHRLDRPTGGVMVFAKTSKSAERLCAAIQEGGFEKKYLTVVIGTPKDSRVKLVNYLKKDEGTNTVSIVSQYAEGAKRAELDYHVLESKGELSLLEVELYTGRSHQIRVQLANAGYPVFGDAKYKGDIAKGWNMALWAYELRFAHPTTKEKMVFIVYPPVEETPWKYFSAKINADKKM